MIGRRHWLLTLLLLPWAMACGSTPPTTPGPLPTDTTTGAAGATITVPLRDRPFTLHVPGSYQAGQPMPLVVLLHGYGSNGREGEAYFKLTAESEKAGFLYAVPEGTKDRNDHQFWSATDACCNHYPPTVDDSSYLSEVIATVRASHSVDPRRVYLVGHSNGGFMAHRMACDHANEITAIVSLAGATWEDASRCRPARPVSVLEIHGTNDRAVDFHGGGMAGHTYPSVATTIEHWRHLDACGPASSTAPAKDLVNDVDGAETTVTGYGCASGTRVELWTINRGSHVPALTADFAAAVIEFLYLQVSP